MWSSRHSWIVCSWISFKSHFNTPAGHLDKCLIFICLVCLLLLRHGESRGAGASGERVPHALPPGLPRVSSRDDEAVLEKGAGWEAHLRVHPVLLGRLLHSYRATVPAGGQPLVWGHLGRGELWHYREVHQRRSKLGTTEKLSEAADALPKLQRKRFHKLVHTHTGILAHARKKKKGVFWSRGLSLVFTRGPNMGEGVQMCRLMLVR